MGSNFKEKSFMNVDTKKFEKGYKKIFGERVKCVCTKCDLSSKQKKGEIYKCPHCGEINGK